MYSKSKVSKRVAMFSVPEEEEVSRGARSAMGSKSTKMLSKLFDGSCEAQSKASKSMRSDVLSPEAEDSMSYQSSVRSEKKSSCKMIPLIFLIGLAGLLLSSFPVF
jgi:hypothetical protein